MADVPAIQHLQINDALTSYKLLFKVETTALLMNLFLAACGQNKVITNSFRGNIIIHSLMWSTGTN